MKRHFWWVLTLACVVGVPTIWPALGQRISSTPMSPGAGNATLPDAQDNLQTGPTLNCTGNGTDDDQACMQAIVTANAGVGATIFGVKGKTYTLRGQVYIPSNTTIDCRGATIQFDPTLVAFVNTMLWIGSPHPTTGTEDAGNNIEIKNCSFKSTFGSGIGYSAITLQPGSSHVTIRDNDFTNTSGYGLRAISMGATHLRDIKIINNSATGVRNLVYVNGDESQAWSHCINILTNTTSQNCAGAEALPSGDITTGGDLTFAVPATLQTDIAAGYGYGIIVNNYADGNNSYRLYGPYDNDTDFTYAGGVITLASALPTAAGTEIQFFTWDPEIVPANDLRDLVVTGNVGKQLRGAGVQINCVMHQLQRRVAYQDCIRNVVVSGNKFENPYQLEGMANSVAIGASNNNRALWSQDFTNAVWTKGNASITTGTTQKFYSPPYDYTPTAQKLVENSSNSTHAVVQGGVTVTAGSPFTWSCFAKADTRTKARLYLLTGAGNGVSADFDLAAGSVSASANVGTGTGVAAGMMYVGGGPPASLGAGGWYRVWVKGVLDAATAQPAVYLMSGGSVTYAGDGSSGLYLWGCQVNAGSTPLVYIPSQGSPAGAVVTQLISLNGVSNFTIADNVLGPAADQCIHIEDFSGQGTVTGNTCRDAGGAGFWLSDSQSIVFKGNSVFNSYAACFLAGWSNPPSVINQVDAVSQSQDITIEGNKCDGNNNPSILYGFRIGTASGVMRLRLSDNEAINLPTTAQLYSFPGTGSISFVGTPQESLLLNPSFVLDQVFEGGNYTATGAAMDGWGATITTAATGVTLARATASPPTGGTSYGLLTIGTGNATVNATDTIVLRQKIPQTRLAGTNFGTADAVPLALSWKQKCSVAGTYGVALQNNSLNRSFVHTYAVSTSWQDFYLVIPGDKTGTWAYTANTEGARLIFSVEAGSTFQTATLDQWQAGQFMSSSAQTQLSQTTGATCAVTDVNLQLAPVPANLLRRPMQQELSLAQRFFRKTFPPGTAVAQNAGVAGARCAPAASTTAGTLSLYWQFDPPMNASPTVTTYNPSAANANWRDVTAGANVVVLVDPSTAKSATGVQIGSQTTALTVGNNHCIHAIADARL